MRVLIIEDEESSAEALKNLLARHLQHHDPRIQVACDFDSAWDQVKDYAFDVIFCDLLLLPQELHITGQHLRDKHTGKSKGRFSPEHWHRFVVEQGGVELIRRIWTNDQSANLNTPIVVMTWFDDLPGFGRLLRMVNYKEDDLLIVLPKVRKDLTSLPPFLANHYPRIDATLQSFFRTLFKTVPPGRPEIAHARKHAKGIRRLLKAVRLRQVAFALGYELQELRRIKTTAKLVIRIDPKDDSNLIAYMYSSVHNPHHVFSGLYEDWLELRDRVLLNPHLDVRFSIEAFPPEATSEVATTLSLSAYNSFGKDIGFGYSLGYDNRDAATIARRLIERCMLAFLAFASEPMQGIDEGWSISEKMLCRAMNDLDHLEKMPYVHDGMIQWPLSQQPIKIRSELERITEGGAVRDRITRVQAVIQRAINSADFTHKDILVPTRDEHERILGYYFNGDIELRIPESESYRPEETEAQRVSLIGLDFDIRFDCLDGRKIGVYQLADRFENANIPIRIFTSDSHENIRQILTQKHPGTTLLLLAPVDQEKLGEFLSNEENREFWSSEVYTRGVKTILVLNSDVRRLEPEELDKLHEAGVDCMYPTTQPNTFEITKVIDHVICSAYRTKYVGRNIPSSHALSIPEYILTEFREIMEFLISKGYDAPPTSGSLSQRLSDNNQFVITTTWTNKWDLTSQDLALVHSYELPTNRLDWSGSKRPSSSSPWHSLIYQSFPNVNYIVHTHWKELTYSERLKAYRTPRYVPAGSLMLAADIVSTLHALHKGVRSSALRQNFVVLNEHGEAFLGEKASDVFELVQYMLQEIE